MTEIGSTARISQSSSSDRPRRCMSSTAGLSISGGALRGSEELVLAAEDLAHRAVAEDAADRLGELVGAGQLEDVARRARRQRDRVRDDDLLEARGGEVL